jgi:cyclophilin family peptidyl-prolyl cis-trans isomerase
MRATRRGARLGPLVLAIAAVLPWLAAIGHAAEGQAGGATATAGDEGATAAGADPWRGHEKVYAVFETTVGPVAVELFADIAPRHVAQIEKLIELGVYDGVPIARIQRGFVAQVHEAKKRPSPLAKHQLDAIHEIQGEFSTLSHERGVLSMARGDDPNSAETSFSFLLGGAPHLDGLYTIFGRAIGNEETLRAIEAEAGPDPYRPRHALAIESARIVNRETAQKTALEPSVPLAPEATRPPAWTLLGLTSAVALLALATSIAALRTGGRGLISLALATFLCAFFIVFAILSQELDLLGALRPWVATLLFAAAVVSFKVMGQYDGLGWGVAPPAPSGPDAPKRRVTERDSSRRTA